jgi:hypothetical protein
VNSRDTSPGVPIRDTSHVPMGRSADTSFIGTRRDQMEVLPLAAVSTFSPKKNHSYLYIYSSATRSFYAALLSHDRRHASHRRGYQKACDMATWFG